MPALLETLPTELLILVIRLSLPPESLVLDAAQLRRDALLTISFVNKRIRHLAKPLLRETVILRSTTEGKAVRVASRKLRAQARSLVLAIPHEPSTYPETTGCATLETLPSVRHASIARDCVSLPMGECSPFRRLKTLRLANCAPRLTLSFPLRAFALTHLALVGLTQEPRTFHESMHPKNLPALRYLRVSGGADAAIVLWAAELANQLVACQVGLCESTGWSQSHRRYAGGLVPEFSSALDKTLFELTTPPAAAAAPPQLGKIRYLLLTDQSRDMATAFLAFCPIQYTSLDAVFIPRKYRIVPATTSCDTSADAFLDAIKTLRAKVVWVEDWDTDFVVPEFERYIAEKKRRAA
ncbi:Proteophosphoglycan ppg4 [Rhodotorula toruloides]|uniref:Proteophosphoglycan ppg4 n=1 Tax=Rhodotorula toruloides TaxID=5286 RepID=A0A2T0ABE0_RHOTO|nr:Proteophosphoglycan ppg4 [Rhodotorula toruloides]